jgi:DNA modification methylase
MTVQLLRGDCRKVLDTLPENSVQCCVTSPPYWGLRSYLPDGHPDKAHEIGSEATVDEWVDVMVDVFRRVRRVLRDDGVLFLNLGDSYVHGTGADRGPTTTAGARVPASWSNRSQAQRVRPSAGLKTKDLIGQPWMAAFALRADGWWLRQEIIWNKPNPMPESARDRCTKAHEHIFLLSKSERYFWNFDAVQEPVNGGAHARRPYEYSGAKRPGFGHGYDETPKPRYKTPDGWDTRRGEGGHGSKAGLNRKLAAAGSGTKNNDSMDEALSEVRSERNPRSVWTFATEPFKGAHFATFPRELARRCITAGTRDGDTVLDPFGGSGTVGMVADGMQRNAVLIDLDERNMPMARDRIAGDAPLFAEVAAA